MLPNKIHVPARLKVFTFVLTWQIGDWLTCW